ncbi:hypothetical protein H0H81_002069 [Sphagnurus paluster]|uniref:F-box domain-containing protein n=1 Tax=Sphagnurus paluster TaxID=117069 RepID=A0A9P7FSP0_9AGAR|nr:hypothetical protein H0H81_002069 [Sphagnurus paluster]
MIDLFPLEILTEIFWLAIIRDPRVGNARLDQAPLSISQVCSTWRKASLNCPKLWSTLLLHLIKNEPPTSSKIIELMTLWYGRAKGDLPLSFSLSHYPKTISGSIGGEIAKALVPFSPRLSHVYFNVPRVDDLVPFLSQRIELSAADPSDGNSPIPLLQKIEICVRYRSSKEFSYGNIFWFAPALRDATMNICSDFCVTSLSLSFPWTGLTQLTLSHTITAGLFSYLITQCLCLTHGSFMVGAEPGSWWQDEEQSEEEEHGQEEQNLPVVAPNLSSLRLRIYGSREAPVSVEDTMRRLILPSMQNLDLLVDDENVQLSSVIPSLPIHSATGSTQLTRLVLVNIFLESKTELLALLHACTALETLALQPLPHHTEEVLDVLQNPIDSVPAPTLPSLAACVLVVDLQFAPKVIGILRSWMEDPERRQALEAVTVYVYGGPSIGIDPASGVALKEIRERLGPWREADMDGYVATAKSGMVLRTRAVFKHFILLGSESDWFE